jgi:putative membrane-bound dehydrogenase-like protein
VEPRSYPNTIRPASGNVTDQKFIGGQDRILILEDTDGDKVMDKVKVFRDGLNLPQGIEVVKGGVVVIMTPYLVYFPNVGDTSGTPQILWSGLGSNGTSWDTHFGSNSLMYGLDNWIYGHTGGNACAVDGVQCGQGKVWRFRHTALGHTEDRFEVWTSGYANAWGIGQMEDGQIFQSAATGWPHISHSMRQGSFARDIRVNGNGHFYPITGDRWLWEGSTAKNAQGQFSSGSTAVSGLQFYTSRLLPQKYWNRYAFACEGASKLCNQDRLEVSGNGGVTGSTWRAVRMPGPDSSNIIASTDAWVAPLLAKTGPDGAVWVLDWYNYLFLHNPATPGGDGRAWVNDLREKSRFRIYRITPTDKAPEPVLDLSAASVPQLVATFVNPNLHWRLQAQRLLVEKGYTGDLGDLLKSILAEDRSVDAVGNNPRVLHALWTLHGLGRFTLDAATWNPILADLLRHPAWGVRRNVLMAMPRTAASGQAVDAECSVNDPHGHVRLQAMIALAGITPKPSPLRPIWNTYRTVDAPADSAATEAGLAGAASKPCEPRLHPVSTRGNSSPHPRTAQPRSDLRFTLGGEAFRLLPHGQLPDGRLTVFDPAGRAVFQSEYLSREARWTLPEARGLRHPVCLYVFRGEDGSLMQGRISLIGP